MYFFVARKKGNFYKKIESKTLKSFDKIKKLW